MDRYDRLLGGMLVSLLLGVVVGLLPAVAFHQGMLGGSLLATGFFWQAVFRNPPVPASDRRMAGVAVAWHLGLFAYLVTVW